MSKTLRHTTLLVLALFTFLSVAAAAQVKKTSNPQGSAAQTPKNAKTQSKPLLQSPGLVGTDEAAQKVAEEENAKARAAKTAGGTANPAILKKGADGAVLEFHSADSSPFSGSSVGTVEAKTGKKSPFRNIHGNVYGAALPQVGQAHTEGGAVGADSKNGKLSIFVKGEHAHASTPAPH